MTHAKSFATRVIASGHRGTRHMGVTWRSRRRRAGTGGSGPTAVPRGVEGQEEPQERIACPDTRGKPPVGRPKRGQTCQGHLRLPFPSLGSVGRSETPGGGSAPATCCCRKRSFPPGQWRHEWGETGAPRPSLPPSPSDGFPSSPVPPSRLEITVRGRPRSSCARGESELDFMD